MEDSLFLWLNSDKPPHNWLDKLVSDDNLQNSITTKNECLGVEIRKDKINQNLAAKIISSTCNKKEQFVCAVDASQFTSPSKRSRFPCIPQQPNNRAKRNSGDGVNEGGRMKTGKWRI